MIYKIIYSLNQQLNDYLKSCFRLTEDIAYVSSVKDNTNAFPANRVSVSIINIERELVGGIAYGRQNVSGNQSRKTAPGWQIKLYALIAAVFSEKQYKESLQIMSGILTFIQKNNLLFIQGVSPSFSIEPVNLSLQELSNLWSIFGGSYYPSLICKIRLITINEQEITDLSTLVNQADTGVGVGR
jgi:hypothetical protein